MDIPATTAATAATATTRSATKGDTEESTGALAADFETFLKLLTTQMQNQDPLKPMESTEFIAQLATFSGVEQQIRSNTRLDTIIDVLGGGSAGLAEWIGREVRAPASADFRGTPIEIGTRPVDGADTAYLVVTNDFGQAVARVQVDPTAETLEWDGTDGLGTTLPEGSYSFTVQSYKEGALLDSQAGTVFSAVTEVRVADGEPTLVLADGSQVALADVGAVR